MDDLIQYLKNCGGRDTLVFDSSEKASLARELLLEQCEKDGIDFTQRPAIDQFEHQLRTTLRDKVGSDAPELAEVR
jgi:hypothetical protein